MSATMIPLCSTSEFGHSWVCLDLMGDISEESSERQVWAHHTINGESVSECLWSGDNSDLRQVLRYILLNTGDEDLRAAVADLIERAGVGD